MQSLDPEVYAQLRKMAKERGISMQELIRAVIVPDWMRRAEDPRSLRARTSRKPRRTIRRARATVTA